MTLSRREALRLAAAVAAAPLVPRSLVAQAPAAVKPAAAATAVRAGRFFDAAQMRLLDELTETIIPADAHSGGARAAGVAAYIDGRLADYDPLLPVLHAERQRWKAGLAAVDGLARETSGTSFMEASTAQRLAVLERMAARETVLPTEEPTEKETPQEEKPEMVGQRFFTELKAWTARGYYTSSIGIHDEMEYKGNKAIVEFSGTDPATLPPVRPPEG